MLKHKDQRVGVFIDVQNMYYSGRNLYNAKVNFGAILEQATSDRKLIRAIAYVIKAEAPEEAKFFEALSNQGFELKMKDLQIFWGGVKKGDWDVGLSIDAISLSAKLDVVVLVTGDGDYVPLVEYLKFLGQRVEVVAFEQTTSGKLIEAADEFFNLSAYPKKFLMTKFK